MSPSSTDRPAVHIFLIHGVGHHRDGDIEKVTEELGRKFDISHSRIHEINWDRVVDRVVEQGALRIQKISALSSGLVGSAYLSLPPAADWIVRFRRISLAFVHVASAIWFFAWFVPFAWSKILPLSGILAGFALVCAIAHGLGAGPSARVRIAGALRPPLLLLIWPLVTLVSLVSSFIFWYVNFVSRYLGFRAFAWATIVFACALVTYLPFAGHLEIKPSLDPDGTLVISNTGTNWKMIALLSCGWALFFSVLALAVNAGLRGLLKAMADVVIYLGNPGYATRVDQAVIDGIRARLNDESAPRASIILAAHSLGSVIIFNCLRTGRLKWLHAHRISFVTMGSPLRRFLSSAFPLQYPEPASAVVTLQETCPRLTWLNIYRAMDPVGARLFSGNGGPGRDVAIGIQHGVITAHVNYWGDEEVGDAMYRHLKNP